MKMSSVVSAIFVLLIASIIGGCSTLSQKSPPPLLSTSIPSAIIVPSPTPVPTLTAIAVPSYTLAPTLTVGERESLITQLLTKDYQCTLPCWGGIEPGVTVWSDAETVLESFAQIYFIEKDIYTGEFQYKGENLVLAFSTLDGVVDFMGVPRFEYPIYRLLQDSSNRHKQSLHGIFILQGQRDYGVVQWRIC
jgi:hypothetical protein